MIIRRAEISDLEYISNLAKSENHSIGFIPKIAYESAITGIKKGKRWSDTCNDGLWVCVENDDLVGFMLMSFGRTAKVNQICIQEDARKLSRGKALLQSGIEHGKKRNILTFGCGCADDLESNFFWDAMGWCKVGSRKGIYYGNTWKESSQRKVNIYRHFEDGLFLPEHFKKNEHEPTVEANTEPVSTDKGVANNHQPKGGRR